MFPRAEPVIWGMQVNSTVEPSSAIVPLSPWEKSLNSQVFGTFSCGPYWMRLFDVVTYEVSRTSCSLWSRSVFLESPCN